MSRTHWSFGLALLLLVGSVAILYLPHPATSKLPTLWWSLVFLYFVVDALIVLFPNARTAIHSAKHHARWHVSSNHLPTVPTQSKALATRGAWTIFVLYLFGVLVLGILHQNVSWMDDNAVLVIFFLLHVADYVCVLFWCPFRAWFLPNRCCNDCRISNWDRWMKMVVFVYVPSVATITLFALSVVIFIQWETAYHRHPYRFSPETNKRLRCATCDHSHCPVPLKQKEQPA